MENKNRETLPPVIDYEKRKKQKTLSRRVLELFIDVDGVDLKKYILREVLIPGVKSTVMNITEMLLYPNSRPRSYYDDRRGHTDYAGRSYYNGSSYNSSRSRNDSYQRREDDRIDYRNIVLDDARDADDLVRNMRNRIADRGSLSVAEFYDMLHLTSDYTDVNWGWTDDRCIGIRRTVNGGYRISVPEAKYLKN